MCLSKMEGITNRYIEDLMSKLPTNFKGVFSSDDIPLFTQSDVSFICNLSKRNEQGTHFIGVYISKNYIIYFDPFGLECYVQNICKYLQIYNRQIVHSLSMIQHPSSLHCGYFCIGFVLAMNNNYSISMYQNIFNSKNLYLNDDIVCDFIVKMIV